MRIRSASSQSKLTSSNFKDSPGIIKVRDNQDLKRNRAVIGGRTEYPMQSSDPSSELPKGLAARSSGPKTGMPTSK